MLKYLLTLVLLCSTAGAGAAEFSVSGTVGDGTFQNKFRPWCWDQPNAHWIDLRTDSTQASGFWICVSDTVPVNPNILSIGSSFSSTLSPALRTAIQTIAGQSITATTIEELVKTLVIPRMPLPQGGQYKIYLGGKVPDIQVVASLENDIQYKGLTVALQQRALYGLEALYDATLAVPVAWATTLATETWNCADSASLTCVHTWTEYVGSGWGIVSNQASISTNVTTLARANSDLATANMEVSVTVVTLTRNASSTFAYCGVTGRKDSSATRTQYALTPVLQSSGEANFWELFKEVAATYTSLGQNNTDFSNGQIAKIRIDGTSISGFENTTLLIGPVTDTSISGNTRGTIYFSTNTANSDCVLDNWNATDYSSARIRSAPLVLQ